MHMCCIHSHILACSVWAQKRKSSASWQCAFAMTCENAHLEEALSQANGPAPVTKDQLHGAGPAVLPFWKGVTANVGVVDTHLHGPIHGQGAAPSQDRSSHENDSVGGAVPSNTHTCGGKTAILAQQALATSQGRQRVTLDTLGPACFNRQGNITDSRHCIALLSRILMEEGFATFRYDAGYCHEACPSDPLMITRHSARMNAMDHALPRPPQEPLKGVFAKTHLVTALQMYRDGQMPELERYVQARSQEQPDELAEFVHVLRFGIYMHVFPWDAVRKHPESFRALMAADNFNHGVGLKESEMRCVYAMSEARGQLDTGAEPREGASIRKEILAHVRKWSGHRWQDTELELFFDFTISTLPPQLDFLNDVWIYAQFESVLVVSSEFFGGLSNLPVTLQWVRTALAVTHFMSDEKQANVCSLGAGWSQPLWASSCSGA